MDLLDRINRQALFHSSFSVIGRFENPALENVKSGSDIPLDLYCELSHVLFSPEGKLSAMGDAALAKVGRKRQML